MADTREPEPEPEPMDESAWLDRVHPLRYGVASGRVLVGTALTFVSGPIEMFRRCPTCEEWSPCRVREAYELLWSLKVDPHGHPGAPGNPAPDDECSVCRPILRLIERDTSFLSSADAG